MSICRVAPTGMGKSWEMMMLAQWMDNIGGKVGLLTNRCMITDNAGKNLLQAGIEADYIARGFSGKCLSNVTVCSAQTLRRRVGDKKIELPKFDLLLVDESHNHEYDRLLAQYREETKTPYVGFTATPVGLGENYQILVCEGTKREGRDNGALVPCIVFAPMEPDMRGVKMASDGEYVQEGMRKRVMQCIVFADIFDNWRKHNPSQLPTLVWAPGVPESRWIVEEFERRGVKAAHIDGGTSMDERRLIGEASRRGEIKVVSSYGVLREGVDWPWMSYGILVQVCGGYKTFAQCVGRILRAYEGKKMAILQDHSGAFWRHGSPNADVEWKLGDTNRSIANARKERIEGSRESEGICCPQCSGVRAAGPKCPFCGYEHTRSVRMIRTVDGELRRVSGSVVRPKPKKDPLQKAWMSCLYSAAYAGLTLLQAKAMFERKEGVPLPKEIKPQPEAGGKDWQRPVVAVYQWLMKRRKKRTA